MLLTALYNPNVCICCLSTSHVPTKFSSPHTASVYSVRRFRAKFRLVWRLLWSKYVFAALWYRLALVDSNILNHATTAQFIYIYRGCQKMCTHFKRCSMYDVYTYFGTPVNICSLIYSLSLFHKSTLYIPRYFTNSLNKPEINKINCTTDTVSLNVLRIEKKNLTHSCVWFCM